jgi:hypothetical protein
MRQVRQGVFETNSSSTHSIVLCTGEEYRMWEQKEMVLDDWEHKLIPAEGIDAEAEPYRYWTHDAWEDECYSGMEHYCESRILPDGTEVIAFGEYGYDG